MTAEFSEKRAGRDYLAALTTGDAAGIEKAARRHAASVHARCRDERRDARRITDANPLTADERAETVIEGYGTEGI